MTRHSSDRNAFIKFDVADEAWALFKEASKYWGMSRASLLREFVDRWNAAYLEHMAEAEKAAGEYLKQLSIYD